MSTISNCTKTSADSSWGIDQIRKEIYIDLNINEDVPECSVFACADSCDGQNKSYSQNTTKNVKRNNREFI